MSKRRRRKAPTEHVIVARINQGDPAGDTLVCSCGAKCGPGVIMTAEEVHDLHRITASRSA